MDLAVSKLGKKGEEREKALSCTYVPVSSGKGSYILAVVKRCKRRGG
jgi:hypothetical protein